MKVLIVGASGATGKDKCLKFIIRQLKRANNSKLNSLQQWVVMHKTHFTINR